LQILDDSNAIGHVVDYEGDPRRRPLTREELTLLFDHLDAKVTGRRALRRKGSLAAFRDAVAFKTIYAWGLRRQEAVRPDLSDFGRNPHTVVRAVRTGECPLRQGVARQRAEATQRPDGVPVVGGRTRAVRDGDPPALRTGRSSSVVRD
jgi:integrase